ncbi:M6 family metalloprotease domain-containing protein [Duganella sp. Root1480D1]|uniref:M6 family metalloprotease domain-containing protein n=1 Tax=Duganella sp. Root1480D1 TaxID=1736471 RepID=UPI00070AF32D|nr:M6 family metalloprotease domain-containing protein [Duganella sp. Root1480D1]KQZ32433.1 peptidase [Duganella sp. Root1480D1]
MRLKVATAAAMLLASLFAQAGIPYKDSVYEFKQPGGEKLRVHLDGNDYYAEQRTDDGSLLVYDAAKKGFCYATVNAAGDDLVSTGVLATNAKVRSLGGTAKKQEGLTPEARARKAKEKFEKVNNRSLESARKSASIAASAPQSLAAPVTGQVKGLTVIIDFPDVPGTITQAQVNSFLNDMPYTGFGNAQSVRGYWQSVSGGKLDYTNTTTVYYRAKYNKAYYADSSLDSGVRSQELIAEALNWLEFKQGFNFASLSVDANKRIRGLNFFYSGGSDSAWSKGLWPHMGWLNKQFCADGVCTGYYQITNMGNSLAIGTFSHETGHLVMGWPDLYDYDGSSEGSAASYCIMGFGSIGAQSQYRPVPPNGFFRYQVGWDTVTELNPALNASAPKGRLSHTSGSHNLYRWTNPAKTDEAFYVEAIYKSDQNLYQLGSGLAVWHIDPAGNNSDEWHPYVQMEHADGRRDPEYNVNRGDATDLYDGAIYKAFYDTVPNNYASRGTNSRWWNGAGSNFGLANISAAAQTISFDVVKGDGTAGGETYTGYLSGTNASAIHPSPYFYYNGGTIKANLSGPSNADFELKLEKWNGSAWVQVASSTSPTSTEAISYSAAVAYYRITVYSYSGSGNYTLTVTK